MTPTLVCLVPVLDRPRNVAPLVRSFNDSLAGENVEASLLFLANPEDSAELDELYTRGCWVVEVPWQNRPRDYSLKMNYGVRSTTSDWILLGADDLRFHPGWFRAAVNVHIQTGCLVIGTNDTVNPLVKAGKHATHPLIHRDYVPFGTIDNPDELLCSLYCHNSVDVEFCETAIARDQFAFARDSIVAHQHPTFDRTIKRDQTYRKGMQHAVADKQLFYQRRRLWNPHAETQFAVTARNRVRVKQRPAPKATWPDRRLR